MFALVLPHRFFGCKGKWVEVVLYRKLGVFLMEKRGNFLFQLKQNECGFFLNSVFMSEQMKDFGREKKLQ